MDSSTKELVSKWKKVCESLTDNHFKTNEKFLEYVKSKHDRIIRCKGVSRVPYTQIFNKIRETSNAKVNQPGLIYDVKSLDGSVIVFKVRSPSTALGLEEQEMRLIKITNCTDRVIFIGDPSKNVPNTFKGTEYQHVHFIDLYLERLDDKKTKITMTVYLIPTYTLPRGMEWKRVKDFMETYMGNLGADLMML